jgi:hypothetical protein
MADSLPDPLWKEYGLAFKDFDDLMLARWLAQTLGQLQGRTWRFSHPLVGSYRLAADRAHQNQIWLKRLVNIPSGFTPAPCCRAPILPLFSRDILQCGLICQHCAETVTPFEELPADLQADVQKWATEYGPVHAVAHWDDPQRKSARDYEDACEDAANKAEGLLAFAATHLMPRFLEHYPTIIWEDHDECLEVFPEDIVLP